MLNSTGWYLVLNLNFVLNEHIERGGAIISSSPETIADQVINIFKEVSLE